MNQLAQYQGTYQLSTKWGGASGAWKTFNNLTINSTAEVFFDNAKVPSGNISQTINPGGGVQYKIVFPDGSYAQINFQQNGSPGYYFDKSTQGWCITGAYQPNSSASGMLDLRGIPVKNEAAPQPVPPQPPISPEPPAPPKPVAAPYVTTGGPAGVTVKLINSSGAGVAGAEAQCHSTTWAKMGKTGTDGLTTAKINDGDYTFTISYLGQTSTYGPVKVSSGSVVVFSTNSVDVAFTGGATPLAPSKIKFRGSDGSWIAGGSTSTAGVGALQLLPGEYTFSVDYRGQSNEKKATVAGATKVAFVLTSTTVTVRNAAGSPLSNATIWHKGDHNAWIDDGKTDANGSLTFDLLDATYMISATPNGSKTATEVQAKPGVISITV